MPESATDLPSLSPPRMPKKLALKRVVLRSLDRVGRWMTRVRGEKAWDAEDARTILVVDLLRIGDTVVCLPAVAALRERFPEARIVAVCRPQVAELFRACPEVDRILAADIGAGKWRNFLRVARAIRTERPDAATLFDRSREGNLLMALSGAPLRVGYGSALGALCCNVVVEPPITWDRPVWEYPPGARGKPQLESWIDLARRLGARTTPKPYRLRIAEETRNRARRKLGALAGKRYAVLHPTSSDSYLWLSDRFAEVASWLARARGLDVAVTGAAADRPLAEAIAFSADPKARSLAGAFSLLELAAVIDEAKLVLCVDTCAGHFASAMGTPAVVLFGPGDPDIWKPYGDGHRIARNERGTCFGCKSPTCLRARRECMEGITVAQVKEACAAALERAES